MQIHKTWWGEEFVSALEGFIDPGRLQRGRAYRTESRILAFDMEKNKVTAKVRGNKNPYFGVYKEPKYNVKLSFKTITKKDWTRIIGNISKNPAWLSKLMLNEVPKDINKAFDEKMPFLPKSFNDIKAECDCPDYANPCKHIAGVYYKIADILDSAPMKLFSLRGIELQALQSELKKSELGKAFAEHLSVPSDIGMEYESAYFHEVKYNDSDRKIKQSNFWCIGNLDKLVSDEDYSGTENIEAALIKKQGDYPAFWNKQNSFIEAMDYFYEHTKKKNIKNLF